MSPTNQTFGWGSNTDSNTSNAGGSGYQTNSTTTSYNNSSYNTNSYNTINNNNNCSGGAQQLPNFQETWGAGGNGKSTNSWAGSSSIFGERNNNVIFILSCVITHSWTFDNIRIFFLYF